jgi:hypothetical protein
MTKLKEHFMNESSLSRVWKHTTQHDSGIISAFRYAKDCGKGNVYTRKENMNRNSILKAKLLVKGYNITPIKGVYIENYGSDDEINVNENSFLIIDVDDKGKLREDLIKFGKMFEQDSITFSKSNGEYFLIGTNKCHKSHPGYGIIKKLGKTIYGSKGVFHSKVSGRPFVFECVDGKTNRLRNFSISEIRSIVNLSEERIP